MTMTINELRQEGCPDSDDVMQAKLPNGDVILFGANSCSIAHISGTTVTLMLNDDQEDKSELLAAAYELLNKRKK